MNLPKQNIYSILKINICNVTKSFLDNKISNKNSVYINNTKKYKNKNSAYETKTPN